MPHGATVPTLQSQSKPPSAPLSSSAVPREPIFEEVDLKSLQAGDEPGTKDGHYNDLGMRKYVPMAGLLRRIKNHFRGPSTANPKLVNYLAAGSIQGLRPLRYEKRVARNRFTAFGGFAPAVVDRTVCDDAQALIRSNCVQSGKVLVLAERR